MKLVSVCPCVCVRLCVCVPLCPCAREHTDTRTGTGTGHARELKPTHTIQSLAVKKHSLMHTHTSTQTRLRCALTKNSACPSLSAVDGSWVPLELPTRQCPAGPQDKQFDTCCSARMAGRWRASGGLGGSGEWAAYHNPECPCIPRSLPTSPKPSPEYLPTTPGLSLSRPPLPSRHLLHLKLSFDDAGLSA
jgi:hypothetical protein